MHMDTLARMHINQNKQLSPTLSLSVWGERVFFLQISGGMDATGRNQLVT